MRSGTPAERGGGAVGPATLRRPVMARSPAVALSERAVDGLLRTGAGVVYGFLYAPILVVVIYAFNGSRFVQVWGGFSTRWFPETASDPTIRHAFFISVTTAATNALLATALGTAAALGLRNVGRRTRAAFDSVMYMTLIVPEIVIAIASLLFFITIGLPLGPVAIVVTHAVFNTSLVTLIMRARLAGMDRTLEEASADLGAPRWGTFRRVTLPQLFPAVLAGALLSFTFSFDDVVLSNFVAGAGSTTLPLRIFSELRHGLTPKANVVGVFALSLTITAIVLAELVLRRSRRS